MNVSDMISELNDFGFSDITSSRMLGFINDAYWDVCSRENWPFLEKSAALTVDTTGKVTSPTDIGKVQRLVDTGLGTRLEPVREDAFTMWNANQLTQTGNPDRYFFIGDQLYVYPISTANSLTLRYVSVPAALTISPDSAPILPLRHHRVVLLGALVPCYFLEDDADNAGVADQMYEARIERMRNDLWMHQTDRPDTIEDVDGHDWTDTGFWGYGGYGY